MLHPMPSMARTENAARDIPPGTQGIINSSTVLSRLDLAGHDTLVVYEPGLLWTVIDCVDRMRETGEPRVVEVVYPVNRNSLQARKILGSFREEANEKARRVAVEAEIEYRRQEHLSHIGRMTQGQKMCAKNIEMKNM